MDTETKGLPVKGYKATQPEWAIDAVNRFKELEERTLRVAEGLPGELAVDQRLLAIGKTQLQGAFMFLARAIFQPQRVELPEDATDGLFGRNTAQPELRNIAWALAKMEDGYQVRRPGWLAGYSYKRVPEDDIGGPIWETNGDGLAGSAVLDARDILATDWELLD